MIKQDRNKIRIKKNLLFICLFVVGLRRWLLFLKLANATYTDCSFVL